MGNTSCCNKSNGTDPAEITSEMRNNKSGNVGGGEGKIGGYDRT